MIIISITILHPDAKIHIIQTQNNKKQILIEPTNNSTFLLGKYCETFYPLKLINMILKIKNPSCLIDEIKRDEDPSYVQQFLNNAILGYIDRSCFENKRILDFGCGSGASTMILGRMFPKSEIIGIDLSSKLLTIANARLKYYNLKNIKFIISPTHDNLPNEIGKFDFIILSAVYEHILPNQRKKILQQLWQIINQNGILFINQTPNRYSPIETHTTNLPFINYLPDDMVLKISRRFSKRVKKEASWNQLLRDGIRGGTVKEIIKMLEELFPRELTLLQPVYLGFKDHIDIWYANLRFNPIIKKIVRFILKRIKFISEYAFLHEITLAIKKNVN